MTIKEAQEQVDRWIQTVGGGYFSPLTNMAMLTEEVGEVARVMARTYGDQIAKKSDLAHNLPEESGDVLWVLLCLANQTGTDLTKALENGIRKRNERDAERFKERRTK